MLFPFAYPIYLCFVGSEEIEAVCIADVLRRAGAEVTIASVEKDCLEIACSRGVKIVADKLMKDCATSSYDLIALPVSPTPFLSASTLWLQSLFHPEFAVELLL